MVKPSFMVVIPAYQASGTIEGVLRRIPPEAYERIDTIIVVNDGSTDGTDRIVEALCDTFKKLRLVHHPQNRGYGAAQKTGIGKALALGAEIVALLHADGQYAPELLLKMIRPCEVGAADLVIGSRMLDGGALEGGMPLYKYLANRSLTSLENRVYGLDISEYHSGYMVYTRRTLLAVPYTRLSDSFHFDGEMLMMSQKKALRLKEIPIPTSYGDEQSHLNPVKYGFEVLKVIFHYLIGHYDRLR